MNREAPAIESVLARVRRTIATHHLIQHGDRIVLAVSGGPDSICLLSVLHTLAHEWNVKLHVAHMNYGRRGRESEADMAVVERVAMDFGLNVTVERDAHGSDIRRSGSFQARARIARYEFLDRVARTYGMNKIATGHTADDQAETVIMWLVRGSGLRGLSGIPVRRDERIIRPLLDVRRKDVLLYLHTLGLAFREDSSNQSPTFQRNRIRSQVLPLLEADNPQVQRNLSHLATIVSDEDTILDHLTHEAFQAIQVMPPHSVSNTSVAFSRPGFLSYTRGLQRRLIREAVKTIRGHTRRFTFAQVEQMLECIVRGTPESKESRFADLHMTCDRGTIVFTNVTGTQPTPDEYWSSQELRIPGEVHLPTIGCTLRSWRGGAQPIRTDEDTPPSRWDPTLAVLDEDTFAQPMIVRRWLPGDAFYPIGMAGKRKKLQDYFIDRKIPRRQRSRIPLVVSPDGILWIAGHRQDHRFRVTSRTRRICYLRLI